MGIRRNKCHEWMHAKIHWHFSRCLCNQFVQSLWVLDLLCYCYRAQDLAAAGADNIDFFNASQASICEDFKELKHLMKETGFRRIAKEHVDEMGTNIRRDLQELQRLFQPRPCQVVVENGNEEVKPTTQDTAEVKSEVAQGETTKEVKSEVAQGETTKDVKSEVAKEEVETELDESQKDESPLGHLNENMEVEAKEEVQAKEGEESSPELEVLAPAPKRLGQRLKRLSKGRGVLKAAKKSKATRDAAPKRKNTKLSKKVKKTKKVNVTDEEKQPQEMAKEKRKGKTGLEKQQDKMHEEKQKKREEQDKKKQKALEKAKKDDRKKKDQEKKRKEEKPEEPMAPPALEADDEEETLRKKLHSVTLPWN